MLESASSDVRRFGLACFISCYVLLLGRCLVGGGACARGLWQKALCACGEGDGGLVEVRWCIGSPIVCPRDPVAAGHTH